MKAIIYFSILMMLFASITFSQSTLDYQTGTGLIIQPGADVCADDVIINGTFSGGGTICGGTAYVLNLTAVIQGFYDASSNLMISDTVSVYLRNATSPFVKIDSAKSVLSPNGEGSFIFFNVTNGTNYYIVLTHRNSIETWSSSGNAFVSGSLIYNFRPAATTAYGSNEIRIDNDPVTYAIYSGDVNQDGNVEAADLALIDNDAFNFVTGYVSTDITGDGIVDASDGAIADNNAFNFVSVARP